MRDLNELYPNLSRVRAMFYVPVDVLFIAKMRLDLTVHLSLDIIQYGFLCGKGVGTELRRFIEGIL